MIDRILSRRSANSTDLRDFTSEGDPAVVIRVKVGLSIARREFKKSTAQSNKTAKVGVGGIS